MGIEENKAIVRKVYDELNKGNFDIYDIYLADSFQAHSIGGVVLDKAGYKQFIKNVSTNVCPDLQSSLEYMVAEDENMWFSWIWTGTDKGGFGGNPSTGRKLVGGFTSFYSIRLTFKENIRYSIDEEHQFVFIHRAYLGCLILINKLHAFR